MPPLTKESKEALNRLRSYQAPPTVWPDMPLSRKAAVLILLFTDKGGNLRVVITMRASSLSSYSGQAALPGGKAEEGETAVQCARREASEEIGLPIDNAKLPAPFRIETLCEMPTNLAKTELVVRPVIAYLHSYDEKTGQDANVGEQLLPRLDAHEVAAVFSAPFKNFLFSSDLESESDTPGKPSDWYKGAWIDWHQQRWRMHNFFVPVTNQSVIKPKQSDSQKAAADELSGLERYKVWGMTARILVDAAKLAYAQEPEFDNNSHFGDEGMIGRLRRIGRLGDLKKPGEELTAEVMRRAANL